MAETTYTYSIANHTSNGAVHTPTLKKEIESSSITISLERIDTASDSLKIVFKNSISAGEETTLDNLVSAHDGVAAEEPEAVTIQGVEKTSQLKSLAVHEVPPEGSSSVFCSHDFTDKTTWYTESVAVVDETLTDSGDGLTFEAANTHFIDMTHGKIHKEDTLNASGDYDITVKVNDVVQASGYTVDYVAGEVTFDSSQTGNTVKCSYRYANGSTWILGPADLETTIHVKHTEVQFSKSAKIDSPINFDTYVYNPADLPNKVMYNRVRYKSIRDIVNESNLGYAVPAIGELTEETIIFPFVYGTVKSLTNSSGAEIRVSIENDIELTGTYGTLTFYCLIKDEV
jgi:hypothetical protein